MENDNLTTYKLPTHWASALINGDYSGLEDVEEKEINDFLEKVKGCAIDVDVESISFERFNDAGTLACECYNYQFLMNS
ncbi:hypothetical protein [Bacteroides sp.]|uniref:hypothetical protein n=1 Tax=Bacteroides sp. TaxID=29523 RepID=UPI0025BFE925|nr:hypothetical protein [Bacteroides sp.]